MPSYDHNLDRAAFIIKLVCKRFDCSVRDLESLSERAEMFNWPRYIAMHLIHANTPLSLTFIGRLFNRSLPEVMSILANPSKAAQSDLRRLNDLNAVAASFHVATAPRLAV